MKKKLTKTKPGKRRDHQRLLSFSARFRSRGFRVSRLMLLMRLVTLFSLLLSFIPSPVSSLHCSLVRSFEVEGRNFTLERNGDCVETCERSIIRASCNILFLFHFLEAHGRLYLFVFSVEEEEACSMRGGHILWHVADFKVVNETPEEQQETCDGGGGEKRTGRFTSQQPHGGDSTLETQNQTRNTHRATGRSTTASTDRWSSQWSSLRTGHGKQDIMIPHREKFTCHSSSY